MNKFLNRLSTLILMLISVIPLVHLIMYSFSLSADQRLPIFLVAAVLFCWLTFSFWRFTLPGILICIALLLLFYQGRSEILAVQFEDMANRMAVTYYNRFVSSGYSFASTDQIHTEAMLFIGFILSSLMGVSLNSREDRIFLPLLIFLPIVFLCLLVYGLMPGWIMLCLVAFVVLLLATGRINEPDGNTGKSFLLLVLPVALTLGILLLFKNPDNYDYQQQQLSLVELAQNFTQNLTSDLREGGGTPLVNERLPEDQNSFSGSQWSISGDTLDISSMPDSSAMEQTLLYVTSNQSGHFYLRNSSYGSYTGTSWSQAPEYPGTYIPAFSSQAIAASGLAQEAEMYISPVSAVSSRLYVPYYCLREYDKESGITGNGSDYTLSFMSFDSAFNSLSLPSEFRDQELTYRQFVYSSYLSLPEGTRNTLSGIAAENSLYGDDVYESIALVAEYVRTRCPYNINTQPYPSDDYAVYLLTQATEGYCVHFATAAAAMYRAMGIPARMVTGVAFDAQADVKQEISGENSHAWVEVYVDALGWLPVEVTPGSYEGPALGGLEEDNQDTQTPRPSPSDSNMGGVNERLPDVKSESSDAAKKDSQEPWRPGPIFIIIALAFVLVLSVFSRYWIKRALWRRSLSQSKNSTAIAAWRCAVRIGRYGGAIPEEVRSAAMRAFYGKGLHDRTQLDSSLSKLELMREQTYASLPWYKKLCFRFFDGLK